MTQSKQFYFKKVFSGALAMVFLAANGVLVYATESNFWAGRRSASQRMRAGENGFSVGGSSNGQMLLAQLPSAGPLELGGGGRSAPFSQKASEAGKVPFAVGPKMGDWLGRLVMPYGAVNDVYLSPKKDAPFIVHIQDAHGIEEAQRNISSMIGLLGQEPGIHMVGVEGAWGSFSLEPYRDFPDPAMTKDIAEFLLKKGLIAGPEYAGLTMPKSPDFFGIENSDLYNANVQALKTAFKDKEAAIAWVDTLKTKTDQLKKTDYSEALKSFDQNFSGYQSEKVKLADYVRYLTTTLNQTKNRPATPQLQLLMEALNQESELDFKRVEAERKKMVEKLVDKLSNVQVQELLNRSIDYRAGRIGYAEYHAQLKQTCQDHGISMGDYPQMARYITYVLTADKINRHGLLNELDRVERTLPESLAKTPKEKELVTLTYDLSLLNKLVRHEMSPTDWTHYLARGESIHAVPQRVAALGGAPSPAFALGAFEDFCRYAAERNTALTGNLTQQMADTKTNSSILIAGGFHTEGLSALLRQKQISYVVVTPKITAIPKDNNYLDVLARDPVPLEQLLAGDRIYLAKLIALAKANSIASELASGAAKAAYGQTSQLSNGLYVSSKKPKNRDRILFQLNLAGLVLYFYQGSRTIANLFSNAKDLFSKWGGKISAMALALIRKVPTVSEDVLFAFGAMAGMYMGPMYPMVTLSIAFFLHIPNILSILNSRLPQSEKYNQVAQIVFGLFFLQIIWFLPAFEMATNGLTSKFLIETLMLSSLHYFQSNRWAPRFQWQRWTSSLLNPPVDVVEDSETNFTSGSNSLLTQDRLQRNLSLSKFTKGVHSVLYIGGGFDLNNVLTTFLDANHVVMIGKMYGSLTASALSDAMKNATPNSEIHKINLSEYRRMSKENGFVETMLVEKQDTQVYFLAQELLALGVNPNSVKANDSGQGIAFEMPVFFGVPARRVSVDFRNNTFKNGTPVRVNKGDIPFDGVYSKAIHDLVFFLEGIWADIAPQLAPDTKMVLNQGMFYSSPFVPGFKVDRIHSAGSEGEIYYGDTFVVYNLTPSQELQTASMAKLTLPKTYQAGKRISSRLFGRAWSDRAIENWFAMFYEAFRILSPSRFSADHHYELKFEKVLRDIGIGAMVVAGLAVFYFGFGTGLEWLLSDSRFSFAPAFILAAAGSFLLGFTATIPVHGLLNIIANTINAILDRSGIRFRIPRLTMTDSIQVKQSDREAWLQILLEAFQNGRLGVFEKFLPIPRAVIEGELNRIAQSIAKEQLLLASKVIPFREIPGTYGGTMVAFEHPMLPNIVIKAARVSHLSGGRITNFEKDVLPGYLLAKERLGGIFALMVLDMHDNENPLRVEGTPINTDYIIVQERVKPLDDILVSIRNSNEREHARQQFLSQIKDVVFKNMNQRGLVETDSDPIDNLLRNYGINSHNDIVGFDVDGIKTIPEYKEDVISRGGNPTELKEIAEMEKVWKGTGNGEVRHWRVHDMFLDKVRPAQITYLTQVLAQDNRFIDEVITFSEPDFDVELGELAISWWNKWTVGILYWGMGGKSILWETARQQAKEKVASPGFKWKWAPLTELPLLPGAVVWGGVSSTLGIGGISAAFSFLHNLSPPANAANRFAEARGFWRKAGAAFAISIETIGLTLKQFGRWDAWKITFLIEAGKPRIAFGVGWQFFIRAFVAFWINTWALQFGMFVGDSTLATFVAAYVLHSLFNSLRYILNFVFASLDRIKLVVTVLTTAAVSTTFAVVAAPIVMANFMDPLGAFFLISLASQLIDPSTAHALSQDPVSGLVALIFGTATNFSTYVFSLGAPAMLAVGVVGGLFTAAVGGKMTALAPRFKKWSAAIVLSMGLGMAPAPAVSQPVHLLDDTDARIAVRESLTIQLPVGSVLGDILSRYEMSAGNNTPIALVDDNNLKNAIETLDLRETPEKAIYQLAKMIGAWAGDSPITLGMVGYGTSEMSSADQETALAMLRGLLMANKQVVILANDSSILKKLGVTDGKKRQIKVINAYKGIPMTEVEKAHGGPLWPNVFASEGAVKVDRTNYQLTPYQTVADSVKAAIAYWIKVLQSA